MIYLYPRHRVLDTAKGLSDVDLVATTIHFKDELDTKAAKDDESTDFSRCDQSF